MVGIAVNIDMQDKSVLLLDMNGTFMFGEDRFAANEDFSIFYRQVGGSLSQQQINKLVREVYDYLDMRYPQEAFREGFPTVEQAIGDVCGEKLSESEIAKIIDTFAFHELGYVPEEYVALLKQLSQVFTLALVIDIWSPKKFWLETFEKLGIDKLFSAMSFSSDHGRVKPSPYGFEMLVRELAVDKKQVLVVGDSIRRDLGGAQAAGLDCVLIGGAHHRAAIASFASLIDFGLMCFQQFDGAMDPQGA